MTQSTANSGLEILVQASLKRDLQSGMIGVKILKLATPEQISTARGYCRIKHRYTDKQIDQAIRTEQWCAELDVGLVGNAMRALR